MYRCTHACAYAYMCNTIVIIIDMHRPKSRHLHAYIYTVRHRERGIDLYMHKHICMHASRQACTHTHTYMDVRMDGWMQLDVAVAQMQVQGVDRVTASVDVSLYVSRSVSRCTGFRHCRRPLVPGCWQLAAGGELVAGGGLWLLVHPAASSLECSALPCFHCMSLLFVGYIKFIGLHVLRIECAIACMCFLGSHQFMVVH